MPSIVKQHLSEQKMEYETDFDINADKTIIPVILSLLLIILGALAISSALTAKSSVKTVYPSKEETVVESVTFTPEIVLAEVPGKTQGYGKNDSSFPVVEAYLQAATEPKAAKAMLLCAGSAAILLGAGMALGTKKKQKENV